jgi:hypothetical protein
MTALERLLNEYKEAQRASPDADPAPFLAQVAGAEREALTQLIDAYLARAPRRAFDPVVFRASSAATAAEGVQRSLAGAGGLWPALLPRLRTQARLRRSELVAELAARLGAQSRQEKVARYYHEMEQGLLPASGVSDAVLEALGRIVGWSSDALRRAGELPAPGGPPAAGSPGAVFARTATIAPDPGAEATDAARGGDPADGDWDEVDRLFRGRQ